MSQNMAVQPSIETRNGSDTYSFFNVFNEIAKSPTFIKLNTPSPTRTQYDASVKELKTTLQILADKQGSHQLPLIPVAGNITADGSSSRLRASVKSKTTKPLRSQSHRPAAASIPTPNQHMCPVAPEASFGIGPFPEAAPGFLGCQTPRSSVQESLSRPASMYSTTAVGRVSIDARSNTSDSVANRGRQRKRSITYQGQRCSPSLLHCCSSGSVQHSPSKRRPFRAIRSLKNLIAQSRAEKRYKASKDVSASTVGRDKENQATGLPISPACTSRNSFLYPTTTTEPIIHIPQAQDFAEQSHHLLPLGQDVMKNAAYNHGIDMYHSVSDQLQSCNQRPAHVRRVSEATSVSSSILDFAWPEPTTHHGTLRNKDNDRPRPDSGLGGTIESLDTLPILPALSYIPPVPGTRYPGASRNLRAKMSRPRPSPPPNYPLPACPQAASTTSRTIPLPFASSSSNPRLKSITAKKGLVVDSASATRTSVCLKDRKDRPATVPSSPLKLRSSTSCRNTRVELLKRKHLSLLVKDTSCIRSGYEHLTDEVNPVRRGSAPSIVQTVPLSERLLPAMKPFFDADKPLPEPPSSTWRQTRPRGSGSSAGKRTKSRRALKMPLYARTTSIAHEDVVNCNVVSSPEASAVIVLADGVPKDQLVPSSSSSIGVGQVELPAALTSTKAHSRTDSGESQSSTTASFSSATQNYDTDVTSPPSLVTSSFGAQPISSFAHHRSFQEVEHTLNANPALLSLFDEARINPFTENQTTSQTENSTVAELFAPSSSEGYSPTHTSVKVNKDRTTGLRKFNLPAVNVEIQSQVESFKRGLDTMDQVYEKVISNKRGTIKSESRSFIDLPDRGSRPLEKKSLTRQQSEGQLRSKKTSEVLAKIQDDFTTTPYLHQDKDRDEESVNTSTQIIAKESLRVPREIASPTTDIMDIFARTTFRDRLDSQRCEPVPRRPSTRPGTATTAKSFGSGINGRFSLFPPQLPPKPKAPANTDPALPKEATGAALPPAVSSEVPGPDNKKRYSLISSFNPVYTTAAGSAFTHNRYHDYTVKSFSYPSPAHTEDEDEDEIIDLTKFLASTKEMDRAIEKNLAR